MPKNLNRRKFLEFLGLGIAGIILLPHRLFSSDLRLAPIESPIKGISPTSLDDLVLADGLTYKVLLKKGDKISATDSFGDCADYTAFLLDPENESQAYLWVNHESINRIWSSDYKRGEELTKEIVDKERYQLGGSIVKCEKDSDGGWKPIINHPSNYRITPDTPIPFNWDEPIKGARESIGMLGNCAGGVTPWGTILTCEENYQYFTGERNHETGGIIPSTYGWEKHYPVAPEHYGWVVEVDLKTGAAQKHIALGRMAHECATVRELEDGRVVVYTGDDNDNEFLYKFIGAKPKSLKDGILYAADTVNGKWLSLDYKSNELLQAYFENQTDVLIQTKKAARLMGATPLNRPEDVEIDPINGNVYVSTTNNLTTGDYLGSILKIEEKGGDAEALSFRASTYMAGGESTGFACPDNLAFDLAANLWLTTDISGYLINKAPYEAFQNNGLFVIPRSGPQAGEAIQLASSPVDAELTGPFFSPDGKTLFLSVQHPGSYTRDKKNPTSTWPTGTKPRSSVVAITGPLLNEIQGLAKS